MSRYNIDLGKSSENSASLFLRAQGYKILEKNYKTSYGEIDIIAKDGQTLCFIEVKSRTSCDFGHPKESVSRNKQFKIIQSAVFYLKSSNLLDTKTRFDVLGMLYANGDKKEEEFELIKDAFSLDGNCPY